MQLVILLTALLGVAASGVIVQRLAAVGLRLIEGYWPPFAGRLSRWRTGAIAAKAESLEKKFQDLARPVLESKSATAAQRAEFADIDQRLRRIPADGDYLPTKTGNILRAGERRPADTAAQEAWLWETRARCAMARCRLLKRRPARATGQLRLDRQPSQFLFVLDVKITRISVPSCRTACERVSSR